MSDELLIGLVSISDRASTGVYEDKGLPGLMEWFGAALAITLGALSHESELVDKLWHPASYLIFPLSGSAFLVDALPEVAQQYVLYIPMVHGTEIVREGYFGSKVHAHYDLGYVLPFCLVLTFVALVTTRWVANRVVPE